jgi:hypothetical protein|tara:strand:+ start:1050 stop:1775 length:726 start_codon:yes stop_codon:yes gene_type:complete
MSNPIASPYADFIQEQKKQKYLKNMDCLMVSNYHVKYYEIIIELQKSIINTLHKNNNKILNKNILEKINDDINKVLPYSEYGFKAYHKKPNNIWDKNKIYIYSHKSNDFKIDEFIADVIISESAKERKTETLLKSEKINYDIIHNLNVRTFASNIQEKQKWEKIKASSYDIQYRIDQINNLKKELDNFVKLFDDSEGYKHTNYSVMELIKDHPKHSDNMKSWLRKQNEYLISYEQFRKENK